MEHLVTQMVEGWLAQNLDVLACFVRCHGNCGNWHHNRFHQLGQAQQGLCVNQRAVTRLLGVIHFDHGLDDCYAGEQNLTNRIQFPVPLWRYLLLIRVDTTEKSFRKATVYCVFCVTSNHKNYNFLEFDWSINLCILY